MKEDCVSFEVAKLLKEKGFDERCIMFYHNNELMPCVTLESVKENASCAFNSWLYEGDYTAPTLQMTMKWLREVHNICIVIDCDVCDSFEFYAKIYIKGEDSWITCVEYEDGGSNDYKQVTDSAIKYCLENLI